MFDRLSARILSIAWPAVFEMVLYMLIGVADVAFVGRLGATPLAAVSLGAEFFFGVVLTLTSLGVGATVLSARYTGAKDYAQVNQVAAQVLILAFILGIFTGLGGWMLSSYIISFFAVEAAVSQIAVGYLRVTFAVAPLALCLYMGNGVFRGNGQTRVPMTIALITNIFNIIGSYTLVFGKFGFPQLGGLGAALATSLAHILGFTLMMAAMISGRWGVRLNLRELLRPRRRTITKILGLGIPAGAEEFFRNASMIASSLILVHLGTQAFASHQIALTVESLSYMPGFGMAIAATSMVGQSLGAKKPLVARQAAFKSLQFALVIMGMAGLLFFFFPELLARFFTNDLYLISTAAIAIKIAAFEQVAIAAEMVFAGALRGTGDTKSPMLVAFFGIWFFRLPLVWIMIKHLHLGLYHVWILFVIDWYLRAAVLLVIFLRVKWHTKLSG